MARRSANPKKPTSSPRREARARTLSSRPRSRQTSIVLKLDTECLISQVAKLHAMLIDALDKPATVTLDASNTQRIDCASLQLLAAFVRDRGKNGREVVWQGTTARLESAARLIGLQALLQLPSSEGSRA